MFYESVPIQIRFVMNIRGNRLNSAGIAQEFITISKITLDHAARKLRNQLRISYEYFENRTNWARINRNPRRIAPIREIFSHNSYKIKALRVLVGTAALKRSNRGVVS